MITIFTSLFPHPELSLAGNLKDRTIVFPDESRSLRLDAVDASRFQLTAPPVPLVVVVAKVVGPATRIVPLSDLSLCQAIVGVLACAQSGAEFIHYREVRSGKQSTAKHGSRQQIQRCGLCLVS